MYTTNASHADLERSAGLFKPGEVLLTGSNPNANPKGQAEGNFVAVTTCGVVGNASSGPGDGVSRIWPLNIKDP